MCGKKINLKQSILKTYGPGFTNKAWVKPELGHSSVYDISFISVP